MAESKVYDELGELSKINMMMMARDLLYGAGLTKKQAEDAFKYVLSIMKDTDEDTNG